VKAAVVTRTGLAPLFALHAPADLDLGLRRAAAQIKASPLVPHRHALGGVVCEAAAGALPEVMDAKAGPSGW
jgi:hypothetical protein